MAEAGLPGYDLSPWFAVFMPAATQSTHCHDAGIGPWAGCQSTAGLAEFDQPTLRLCRLILLSPGPRISQANSSGKTQVSETAATAIRRQHGVALTEYFDPTTEANGNQWLWITTILDDQKYLNTPYITSVHFKKQADATGWDPQPCSSR